MNRFKIISDGRVNGTRVIDTETGEVLDNVESITWDIGVGRVSSATITLIGLPVEIETEATIKTKGIQIKTHHLPLISVYCDGQVLAIQPGFYSAWEIKEIFRVTGKSLYLKTESDLSKLEDDDVFDIMTDGFKFITGS